MFSAVNEKNSKLYSFFLHFMHTRLVFQFKLFLSLKLNGGTQEIEVCQQIDVVKGNK